MRNLFYQTVMLASAALIPFAITGCAKQPATEVTVQEGAESDLGEPEEPAVEELSAEDLALVEAQIFCPVGGKLGGMGTPVKVMVEGKPVFICCEHCREPLLDDPAKYLAELEKKKQEAAAENETPAEEDPADK